MQITRYRAMFVLVIVGSSFIACAPPGGLAGSQAAGVVGTGGVAMTAPSPVERSVASAGPNTRQVSMMDACDGPTFNVAIGPGTCSRTGGVSFSEFVALLTAHQSAGAWHNAPSQTEAKLGDALVAVNKGGETHTFTRVAAFGGGIVPLLNDLSGTPNVAPECTTEKTFVPPGGTDTEALNQTGDLKFQCCIHPWMHTTVLVK
jgi:hypothetical protein